MHLMSTLPLSCNNFSPSILLGGNSRKSSWILLKSSPRGFRRKLLLTPRANSNEDGSGNNESRRNNRKSKKATWWNKFFFEEEGNWLGLKDEDMLETEEEFKDSGGEEEEEKLSEKDKFEEWKKRAEAIVEIREAQEGLRNEESRNWEDWIVADGDWGSGGGEGAEGGNGGEDFSGGIVLQEGSFIEKVNSFVFPNEDDEDLLYEDRVFRYASNNSAKFLAVLILVPWVLDFAVHDYALMPFLDRYVKKVPLAAQMLDVRRSQKLDMVKELKLEGARLRLEAEIGKSPPLSEDETWLELRHKALELRDEKRLENRKAFANIWSDMVFGLSLFILLYFNQSKVALLKFTGYKILNNISDTGKAFLIILITDIFLGYHSESGWQTLCEIIVEHYGIEADPAAITIFICLVPVVMDACVKLWLFKFLPRLSPKVSNIFKEMQRH